ncbi:MAG TPA: hypothetical protein VH109_05935 [Steroidobacteraceae bacterium]|jgi:hypothetical protein|nr:hypothetical protein [Steroidobacteraceae bacterium]
MPTPNPYWFRAKRVGWGWGAPASPAGWIFFTVWVLALAVGMHGLRRYMPLGPLAFFAVMTAVLVLVCRWKGEPLS